MYKKPVIVFEGIEGSGKTLHINYISKYLKIKKTTFNRNTDLLLYLAARSENIAKLKKYYKKKIILIDRFVDSTIAYQHYGFGIDLSIIKYINDYLLKNFKVDFTFLNLVNMKNMAKRLNKRKNLNRYDKFENSFYKKVQNGFIKIAKKKVSKYEIINSNLEIEYNKQIIKKKIDKLIK